jgi:hypothetical protein
LTAARCSSDSGAYHSSSESSNRFQSYRLQARRADVIAPRGSVQWRARGWRRVHDEGSDRDGSAEIARSRSSVAKIFVACPFAAPHHQFQRVARGTPLRILTFFTRNPTNGFNRRGVQPKTPYPLPLLCCGPRSPIVSARRCWKSFQPHSGHFRTKK